MRRIDRIKREGQKLAKSHGHAMSKFYWQPSGYWISQCGYLDHKEMIIELRSNKNNPYYLWGDAINKDCVHKDQ